LEGAVGQAMPAEQQFTLYHITKRKKGQYKQRDLKELEEMKLFFRVECAMLIPM